MRTKDLVPFVALTALIYGLFSGTIVTAQQKAISLDGRVNAVDFSKGVPDRLNYQGFLANTLDSSAVTAALEMTFKLFDSEIGGSELWSETHPSVAVSNGLFQVLLGSIDPLPGDIFSGTPLWLQTEVGTEVLTPRKPLVSVAYSQRTACADHADTADWAADAQHAIHADTAAYSPMAGAWTVSGDDVYRETGMVGIGTTGPMEKLDVVGNIQASGTLNSGSSITIDGGNDQITSSTDIEVHVNSGRALRLESNANSPNLIGGYNGNNVSGGVSGAAIGGGGYSGSINSVSGNYSTVAGGHGNTASSDRAFVGGGQDNTASSSFATVGGGWYNEASNPYATVGGGSNNNADGQYATVSGGSQNTASGNSATVAGGSSNTAAGDHSFAAGRRAKANHNGAFVWADGTDADFVSTGDDQFLIRASGGVGIGTASPARTLHVNGDVEAVTYYGDGSNLTGIAGTPDNDWTISGDNIYREVGKVGIGTTNPTAQLEVLATSGTGVYGVSNSDAGVYGHSGSGQGVLGSSTSGHAGYFVGDIYVSDEAGIGISSPSYKLDVNGDINTATLYRIGGLPVLSVQGTDNTFVGAEAGYSNAGSWNTFIGHNSGYSNTSGIDNTFLGTEAGYSNTTGHNNTFIGFIAGYYNTSGYRNTFVGENAGGRNTTGNLNTFIGQNAGYYNIAGSNNVFLGNGAGQNETGSDKLYIANGPDTNDVLIYGNFTTRTVGIGTLNSDTRLTVEGPISGPILLKLNQMGDRRYAGLRIDRHDVEKWFIGMDAYDDDLILRRAGSSNDMAIDTSGNVGIGTKSPTRKLWVNGDAGGGTQWYNDSDERLKRDIIVIDNALDKVSQLQGVYFEWKDTENRPPGQQIGMIAQDVKEVVPQVVEKKGEYYSMAAASLVPLLIEAIKEQQEQIEALKAQLAAK